MAEEAAMELFRQLANDFNVRDLASSTSPAASSPNGQP